MDLKQERLEILRAAFEQRSRDVMFHQINIDNYRLAIGECGSDLSEFAAQLNDLLQSSIREQAKERVMLKVIEQQLEADNVRPA
jgi:hypothetical protein